jgi:beta-glucosidase
MQKLQFPKDFMWGVATSAYQIEGGNSNSDWWEWEKQGKADNESGAACDYWNKFKSDHDLLVELGCGVFRLGIEWARIEPKEGEFSKDAIEHYREILQDLKSRNIKTQVTLWHWTSPIWYQENYGLHNEKTIEIFARYTSKIVEEFGEFIDSYITFNEPMVPLGQGFLAGVFPPGFKNPIKFSKALNNLAATHKISYEIIHEKYPDAQVGITYLYNWYESEGFGLLLKTINKISQWFRVDLLAKKVRGYEDFIGIDYYRLGKITFRWDRMKMDSKNQTYLGFTIEEDLGNVMKWISYPQGFYNALKQASEKFKLPIYVTENGVPTREGLEDEERVRYLKQHIEAMHQAMLDGVQIKGYNFWSLMDNLEWLYGYEPKFGLVEVDYKTLERKPRMSFYEYAKICKSNALEIE